MKNILKLFSFKGRASRTEFWLVLLLSVVVLIGLDKLTRPFFDKSTTEWVNAPVIIALLIPFFWINIATEVRRLHDMEKSGFWAFIQLVPYLGAAVALVWFGFFAGNNGENRYGAKSAETVSQIEEK